MKYAHEIKDGLGNGDYDFAVLPSRNSNNEVNVAMTQLLVSLVSRRTIEVGAEHVIRSKYGLPMKVSHVEELGNETLIYGDFDLTDESIGESKTKAILKVGGYPGIEFGDILHLSLVPEELHFFDPTTEESILKRIPDPIPLPVEAKNGSLISGDWKRTLPPSLPLEEDVMRWKSLWMRLPFALGMKRMSFPPKPSTKTSN